MTFNFTVSPDFNLDHVSGWFIFNTWLQKVIAEPIHLELYNDFESQRQAICENKFDLIYANPYDATVLVREKGFVPIAAPQNHSDEAIIAVNKKSLVTCVEELPTNISIASTGDPDVNMMCMIMLEPADITMKLATVHCRDTYILVAKELINQKVDIGFFLEETYDNLSSMIRQELRPLVHSQIQVVNHVLLVGSGLVHRRDEMQHLLLAMNENEKGRGVLDSLGIDGWKAVEQEDTEFMIDLMDTLNAEEIQMCAAKE